MKNTITLILLLLSCNLYAIDDQPQSFFNISEKYIQLPDPTLKPPSIETEVKTHVKSQKIFKPQKKGNSYSVTAIFFSEKNKIALINNKWVKDGDQLAEYKVDIVNKNTVELRVAGKTIKTLYIESRGPQDAPN